MQLALVVSNTKHDGANFVNLSTRLYKWQQKEKFYTYFISLLCHEDITKEFNYENVWYLYKFSFAYDLCVKI